MFSTPTKTNLGYKIPKPTGPPSTWFCSHWNKSLFTPMQRSKRKVEPVHEKLLLHKHNEVWNLLMAYTLHACMKPLKNATVPLPHSVILLCHYFAEHVCCYALSSAGCILGGRVPNSPNRPKQVTRKSQGWINALPCSDTVHFIQTILIKVRLTVLFLMQIYLSYFVFKFNLIASSLILI